MRDINISYPGLDFKFDVGDTLMYHDQDKGISKRGFVKDIVLYVGKPDNYYQFHNLPYTYIMIESSLVQCRMILTETTKQELQ